jgi:ligand-binding sensor domain-containing protein
MRNKIFIFCIVVFQFTGISYSGEWINYTNENHVSNIAHFGDSIWITSYQGGLIHLDAKTDEFKIYNKANSKLLDNQIKGLAVDSTGSLYIGSWAFQTIRGSNWTSDRSVFIEQNSFKFTIKDGDLYTGWGICLRKFDGSKWDSVEVGSPLSSSFSFYDILPISNDSIWVCGYDGLYLVRNFSSVEQVLMEPVTSLIRDSSGTILCGTWFSGIKKLNGTTWSAYDTSNCELPSNYVQCMKFDSKRILWVGTNAGLVRFDGSTWTVYDSAHAPIPANFIRCIDIDEKDRVWTGIGYFKGLFRFDGTSWKNYSFGSVPFFQCYSVAHDKNNTAWISCYTGENAVTSFNGIQWKDFSFSTLQTLPAPLREIYTNSDQKIWTDSQIAVSLPRSNSAYYSCRTNRLYKTGAGGKVIRDKNGNIWTAINGRLCTFDGMQWHNVNSQGFPIPAAYVTMACGFDGKIYIAGEDNDSSVLVSFDGQNWKTVYHNINNLNQPDSVFYISALAIDTENNVWAGASLHTHTGPEFGLGILRFTETACDTYNIYNSGNPSNTVWALEFDTLGNLWAGGTDGLVKYDGQEWTVYNRYNSGLPDNFINAITIDANNNKWIATNFGGLAIFREGGTDLQTRVLQQVVPMSKNVFVSQVGIYGKTLMFATGKSCRMVVALYDLSGRCINKLPLQWYYSGTHKLDAFKEFKSNGIFIVTFSGPEIKKQAYSCRVNL